MKPVRIVLDTNVYVMAALNSDSLIYKIVEDSAAQHLAIYFTSPEILQELQAKLEGKFQQPRAQVVRWISQLEYAVSMVRPRQKVTIIQSDPDDNKILECALEAKADLIISADKDLLRLKEFERIKIMHPSSVKYIFPQLG